MTRYTEANIAARLKRLRAIERNDTDKFRPNPLGPGFITRYQRYTECYRELNRRLAAAHAADDAEADFEVQNHGTIFLLLPLTQNARDWVADHIPADAQWSGRRAVVVEHRFIADIVDGFLADGLTRRQ